MNMILAILLIVLAFVFGVLSVWLLERITEKGWKKGFLYESLEALELPLLILWLFVLNGLAVSKAIGAVAGIKLEEFSTGMWIGAGLLLAVLILGEMFLGISLDRAQDEEVENNKIEV